MGHICGITKPYFISEQSEAQRGYMTNLRSLVPYSVGRTAVQGFQLVLVLSSAFSLCTY